MTRDLELDTLRVPTPSDTIALTCTSIAGVAADVTPNRLNAGTWFEPIRAWELLRSARELPRVRREQYMCQSTEQCLIFGDSPGQEFSLPLPALPLVYQKEFLTPLPVLSPVIVPCTGSMVVTAFEGCLGGYTVGEILPKAVLYEATQLLALPDNWDSYGARPVEMSLLEVALGLVAILWNDNTPPPALVPMQSGGVQLEWHTNGIDLEIGVESISRVYVFCEDQERGERWEEELAGNLSKLSAAINRLAERKHAPVSQSPSNERQSCR